MLCLKYDLIEFCSIKLQNVACFFKVVDRVIYRFFSSPTSLFWCGFALILLSLDVKLDLRFFLGIYLSFKPSGYFVFAFVFLSHDVGIGYFIMGVIGVPLSRLEGLSLHLFDRSFQPVLIPTRDIVYLRLVRKLRRHFSVAVNTCLKL